MINEQNNNRVQQIHSNGPSLAEQRWIRAGLYIVTATFVFVAFHAISLMIKTWQNRDEYSHGFLIPFISLYIIWQKREALKRLVIKPNMVGGIILTLVGCALMAAGHVSGTATPQEVATIIIIPGLVWMLLGTAYLKALAFPLAYLVFMVPILDFVIVRLHEPSQLFTAMVAGKLLQIMQIPVHQESVSLFLPSVTLEVANSCSGVRFLISIIAIGIPVAYFTQKTLFRRTLLVVLAVVVGILTNPVRVALIGVWAYYGGEVVHGPMHVFQGLFVAVIGYCFLFVGAWGLHKIPLRQGRASRSIDQQPETTTVFNLTKFTRAWITAMAILVGFGISNYQFSPEPKFLSVPLDDLPQRIGAWSGNNVARSMVPPNYQNADQELTRTYRNPSGHTLKLYIGYYSLQKQDNTLIHYSKERLYDNTTELIIKRDDHEKIQVNKTYIHNGANGILAIYWYDLHGRIVADQYKARLLSAFDGLIYGRNNGAIIIVSCDMNSSDEEIKAMDDMIMFVKQLLPLLGRHFS